MSKAGKDNKLEINLLKAKIAKNASDIRELKQKLRTTNKAVVNNANAIAALKAAGDTTLTARVTTLEKEVKTVHDGTSQRGTRLRLLEGRMVKAESAIATNNQIATRAVSQDSSRAIRLWGTAKKKIQGAVKR